MAMWEETFVIVLLDCAFNMGVPGQQVAAVSVHNRTGCGGNLVSLPCVQMSRV
jgi:hypothetical protein